MFINSEVIVKSIIDPDNIDLSFSLRILFLRIQERLGESIVNTLILSEITWE